MTPFDPGPPARIRTLFGWWQWRWTDGTPEDSRDIPTMGRGRYVGVREP
jgi:hypothetical protein